MGKPLALSGLIALLVCPLRTEAQAIAGLRGATLTLSALSSEPGSNWIIPATVEMTVTHPASSFFFGSNGKDETGSPIFSSEPTNQGATFYRCDTVTGFPPGGGRAINRSGGSSFIAIKQEPDGTCKTWICASAGAFQNFSYWEFQIKYFSGDPKKNIPPKMEIGIVPGSGFFTSPRTVTSFNVKLDGGDLKLVALEVTQVVQDLENSVPLIAGKRTLVRAFIESRTGEEIAVSSTDLKLRAFRKVASDAFDDLGYAYSTRPFITARSGIVARRNVLEDTLNWELPYNWIREGADLVLQLEGAGFQCQQTQVTFEKVGRPVIKLIPVVYFLGNKPNEVILIPSAAELSGMRRRVEQMLPVDAVSWQMAAPEIRTNDPSKMTETETLNLKDKLVFRRWMDRLSSAFQAPDSIYLGFAAANLGGRADDIPGDVAVVGTLNPLQRTAVAVHELGHVLGRLHVDFFDPGLPPPKGTDPNYPLPTNSFSPSSARTPLFGLDFLSVDSAYALTSNSIVNPQGHADIMSYCTSCWISAYTYNGMLAAIKKRFPVAGASAKSRSRLGEPSVEYALISGIVDPVAGTSVLNPITRIASSAAVEVPNAGNYSIQFIDGSGGVIANYAFEPNESTEGGNEQAFTFALPWNANTRTVVLVRNSMPLKSRPASANPPIVQVTAPNGGESFGAGDITLSWTGSDPDSDPLKYSILFSSDAGTTWETVATAWETNTSVFRAGDLLRTTQGLFRVIATDGFHSASDDSDVTFTVANNPLRLEILSPASGQDVSMLASVALRGAAFDRDDGELTDIQWSSDLSGVLGTGIEVLLDLAQLASGTHVITATVVDSAGAPGSASIQLRNPSTGTALSFVDWKAAHFSPAELADAAISGDTADAEPDGVNNWVEYAIGLDPKTSDAARLPTGAISNDGHMTLTYFRAKTSGEASITVEAANDLRGPWSSGSAVTSEAIIADDGVLQTIVATDLAPISGAATRFMRLRIQSVP